MNAKNAASMKNKWTLHLDSNLTTALYKSLTYSLLLTDYIMLKLTLVYFY